MTGAVSGSLDARGRAYRRTVWAIALGVGAFAAAQAAWALAIGSQQLLKDALDWGYTVLLNAVAALVFGRGARAERASAWAIAAILTVAGAHGLLDLWDKVASPRPVDPGLLGFSAASATAIGLAAAAALARFRRDPNPLVTATWLSARNDAVVTALSSGVTLALRLAPVRWPEHALDLLGAALAFQAAAATARAAWRDRARGDGEQGDHGERGGG